MKQSTINTFFKVTGNSGKVISGPLESSQNFVNNDINSSYSNPMEQSALNKTLKRPNLSLKRSVKSNKVAKSGTQDKNEGSLSYDTNHSSVIKSCSSGSESKSKALFDTPTSSKKDASIVTSTRKIKQSPILQSNVKDDPLKINYSVNSSVIITSLSSDITGRSHKSNNIHFEKQNNFGVLSENLSDDDTVNKLEGIHPSLDQATLSNSADRVETLKSDIKKNNITETEYLLLDDVIEISDDEDNFSTTPKTSELSRSSFIENHEDTNSSVSTVIYSLTPSTSQSMIQPSPHASWSSQRKNKYYSPTKHKVLSKHSTVKRNLNRIFDIRPAVSNGDANKDFEQACEQSTDKTVFLLKLINSYLKDNSLRRLLDEESQELLSKSFQLVKPGMGLVCRLFWRKRIWYKFCKISGIVIKESSIATEKDVQQMLDSLISNGFLIMSSQDKTVMTFKDYVEILSRDEIKEICKYFKLPVQNKMDAITALELFSHQKPITSFFSKNIGDNSQKVLKIMSAKAGTCYHLSVLAQTALSKLYELMYLGVAHSYIRDAKLELMLINDKSGIETFPIDKSIKVDNASIIFENSKQFESYWNARRYYEDYLKKALKDKINQVELEELCDIIKETYQMYNAIDEEDMRRYASLPDWLRRFTPAHCFVKILDSGVKKLKQSGTDERYRLALDVLSALMSQNTFMQHSKHEWYAEKALILHKHYHVVDQCFNKAAEVLLEGFKSDISERHKDHLCKRALILANQKNITLDSDLKKDLLDYSTKAELLEKHFTGPHVFRQPMDSQGRGRVRFQTRSTEGRTVEHAERACISYYIDNFGYTNGEHWEGDVVATMFFLLFWDIIYSPLPAVRGVFMSHYQTHPLDLYSESFYLNRRALVENRLKKIKECSETEMLSMMLDTWDKRPSSEVSGISRRVGVEALRALGACLAPAAAAAVCRRFATDYAYARSGFPDLTLWNADTKKIKFVEVKTDTDKPSVKQLQWLRYLRENGIEAEFCYIGANTTRPRARAAPRPARGGDAHDNQDESQFSSDALEFF